jgi:hypothetical protein
MEPSQVVFTDDEDEGMFSVITGALKEVEEYDKNNASMEHVRYLPELTDDQLYYCWDNGAVVREMDPPIIIRDDVLNWRIRIHCIKEFYERFVASLEHPPVYSEQEKERIARVRDLRTELNLG